MSQMKDPNQIIKKRKDGSLDVGTINNEPSLTQQQYKDECDINNIMRKYQKTGEFNHLTRKEGVYGDFSDIKDYQGMLDTVLYAQKAFETLPAQVRLKFRNNPGELIDFLQDDRNYNEAVKLGLVENKTTRSLEKNDDEPNNDDRPKKKNEKLPPPNPTDE